MIGVTGMAAIESPFLIYRRFAEYYLRKLRAPALALSTKHDSSFGEALNLFDQDLAQIRQAHAWLSACAPENSELARIALIYAQIDNRLLALRLSSDEQMTWFKTGLDAARQIQDAAAVRLSLYRVATIYNDTGRYDQSLPYLQELLSVSQATQANRDEAKAWLGFGSVAYHRGQQAEAQQAFETGVALLKATDDKSDVYGLLVANLAMTYSAQGQHELARSLLQEPVAIFRAEKDFFQLCTALNNLGNEYNLLGQYAEALAAFEEGLQIARAIGHDDTAGYLLGNIGLVNFSLGQIDAARTYLEESIAAFRTQDDLFGILVMSAFLFHVNMTPATLNASYRQLCDLIRVAYDNQMIGIVLALLTGVAKWHFLAGDPARCLGLLDFVTAQPELDHEWLQFTDRLRRQVTYVYPDISAVTLLDQSLPQLVADSIAACE
jgi:tetratricopeptide (TPR) repeat protein